MANTESGWFLAPHICRVCFARVLEQRDEDGHAVRFRCSGCGAQAEGHHAKVICACGFRLRNGADPGVRCRANPSRSPEFPAEIIAEVGRAHDS